MVTAMGLVFLLIGLAIAMLGPVLAEVAVAKRPRRKRRRRKKSVPAELTSVEPTSLRVVSRSREHE